MSSQERVERINMSWDVMIFKFRGEPPPFSELEESDLMLLGGAEEVRGGVSSLLSNTVDWSDLGWGVYEGNGFSIEFNIGKDDPVNNMMLHVRGGGDAIGAIVQFAKPLGWSVFDCSTSEFLDLDKPSQDGWEGFQAFRDKAFGKHAERQMSFNEPTKPWWKFW